jgi:uncharacterized membrane protein YebE (DUF533 family)
MTVPASPSLSPQEMNLLRTVCAMAWSDGEFSAEELELIVTQLSRIFAETEAEEEQLQQELRQYAAQNIALEQLVPNLETEEDREFVLKLGYMVIRSSQRDPQEAAINPAEKAAYRRLVELLNLPEETVGKVEWAAADELQQHEGVVPALTAGVRRFFKR